MKTSLLSLLLAIGKVLCLHAQSDSTGLGLAVPSPAVQTNKTKQVESNIEIFSDHFEFESKARLAVYRGNVRVEGQGMHLTCESLTARLPASGSRLESFVAEENVVIDLVDGKGQKVHGTGNRLVYTYSVTGTATNETVVLTGNPVLDTAQAHLTGERVTYDLLSSKLITEPAALLVRPAAASKTNAVAATNAPVPVQTPPP